MGRFVVYGAGAIGGTLGVGLFAAGHKVTLIARGAHYEAIAQHGLTLHTPEGSTAWKVDVARHPSEIDIEEDDVILLAMKSQDTHDALQALLRSAPRKAPIACVQNGVDNERAALRLFPNVYGVLVVTPGTHLAPGEVIAPASPVKGVLDVGRFPRGSDSTAIEIGAAFESASFSSIVRDDITRWKYAKLLANLTNAAEVVLGPEGRAGEIAKRARDEAAACLASASIDYVSDEEFRTRRVTGGSWQTAANRGPHRSSTSQSVARGTGRVETDYLNGEIVLLGRLHGVPTPVNELLQSMAEQVALGLRAPESASEGELLSQLPG